jgi:hypothetical protein
MTAIASYKALFKKGGTATTFTTEAFTTITTNRIFQITDTDKRVWDTDIATNFNFFNNGTAIPAADIEYIDLMQGIVKFNVNKTGTITGTGKFIPLSVITYANEATVSVSQEIVDVTTFASLVDDNDFRRKQATLKDVTISLSGFFETNPTFFNTVNDAEDVLIECSIRGATERIKGWFKAESFEKSNSLSDMVKQALSFQGNDKSYYGGTYPRRGYFIFN